MVLPVRIELTTSALPRMRSTTELRQHDHLPDSGAGLWKRAYGRSPCLRSEEHTSELQSLMRISYAVFCLKKKKNTQYNTQHDRKRYCCRTLVYKMHYRHYFLNYNCI